MAAAPVHVWEKREISLKAEKTYKNPYTEVDVWVDLEGPGFHKRVYGFWDGGAVFRVRVLATAPGAWRWTSGSNPRDSGLGGKSGSFPAVAWSEEEKAANICRRGFVRATPNGHAFEHADGTPCFLLGDTWWAAGTFRFRWTDDDASHSIGPEATFKDYVRFRKSQSFNSLAILAAFPSWANDGQPATLSMNDPQKTIVRSAWAQPGTASAKDMHNEGGRPFFFPGRVPGFEDVFPDVERINPAYFQHLDKKLDYLNAQGFIPFLEVARRDVSTVWKKYYPWPDSYARYIQYVFSRYQANNMLLSPIHFDTPSQSIPAREYSPAVNLAYARTGPPPFGTLVSTNSNPSSLVNFGSGEDARWLTFHQTGNQREHEFYWHHTEVFWAKPALPSVTGEPYYAGIWYKPGVENTYSAPGNSEKDNFFCRSVMYGNFLSGGLGGHIYGADGIWQASIEPQAEPKMWEAFLWKSAAEIPQFRAFVFSEGRRYQDLIPAADYILPNSNSLLRGYEGWAFCSRTQEKDLFLAYLEKDCPRVTVRSALPNAAYVARWFNPRSGEWTGAGTLRANVAGRIQIPPAPSAEDWALSLKLAP
ncbi:MAG: DUF4038 domain-containing protein [Acidobacteria bacterium]|nr:DUF4038 domain-containing protein [Acidobacteriota bacterium]